MLPPTNPDAYALYLAARRARSEAMYTMLGALLGLFRRVAPRPACDDSWALAEAPRSR